MKKILFVLFYTSLLLVPAYFIGCVPSKPQDEVEIVPSDRLVKKLEANRRKVKNFEGTGSIYINSPELNTTASFKVTLQKPDSVYLEIYGPFGIDVAQAIVTGSDYIFYDAIHNTAYKGKSNSDVLKKIFKVDLSFSDLIDAFTGAVNLTHKLQQQPSNYEIIYNKYILTFDDSLSQLKSKYTIDIRDLVITDYQLLDPAGKPLLQSVYSKFNILQGISIPYNTKIDLKDTGQSLKIEYRKIDLNKNSVKMSLIIPEDAEVIQW